MVVIKPQFPTKIRLILSIVPRRHTYDTLPYQVTPIAFSQFKYLRSCYIWPNERCGVPSRQAPPAYYVISLR